MQSIRCYSQCVTPNAEPFCFPTLWLFLADMLRELHSVDIEHIDQCAIEDASDNTTGMHAIAERFPKLLSFA